jgi:hypothetical protein
LTAGDDPADRRGADVGAGRDALEEGLAQPYERHLAKQFDLESAGQVRLVLALLYGDLDEKGYCFCPCHSSLGETPKDSPDCPCGWEEERRRYAARRSAPRRVRQHGSLPEAVAALRRRDEEERAIAEWLAAHPGVEATLTCDFSPEQWEGTVDGHIFYFRERHGRWRLEIDGDESAGREGTEIASGLDDVLGDDFVSHLSCIVETVRDHLRAETCSHAGALAFCPHCGRRMGKAR